MIITNSCSGALLYKRLNIQYKHPFISTRIYAKDFIKLIENYKIIDFNNIEVTSEKQNIQGIYLRKLEKPIVKLPKITIDNLFSIYFVHKCHVSLDEIRNDYIRRANRFKSFIENGEDIKFIFVYRNKLAEDFEINDKPYLDKLRLLQSNGNVDICEEYVENSRTKLTNMHIQYIYDKYKNLI